MMALCRHSKLRVRVIILLHKLFLGSNAGRAHTGSLERPKSIDVYKEVAIGKLPRLRDLSAVARE